MKPFNLEAAKAGAPVMLDDGTQARIICFDRDDVDGYNLIVLRNTPYGEKINYAKNNGDMAKYVDRKSKLVMAPVNHRFRRYNR